MVQSKALDSVRGVIGVSFHSACLAHTHEQDMGQSVEAGRTWVLGVVEGGGEDLPSTSEVHEIELAVQDKQHVQALVVIHDRRSLVCTHLCGI